VAQRYGAQWLDADPAADGGAAGTAPPVDILADFDIPDNGRERPRRRRG
jgi:hypothetical protein